MRTVAICDDDALELESAALTLRRFSEMTGRDVVLELFRDAESCIAEANRFDVVFMDIEFEDGPQGIDAAARINAVAPRCQIVYLTNYLHYALDVYDTEHSWYVLKEQLLQRLPEIFQKLALIDSVRHVTLVVKPVSSEGAVRIACGDICALERAHRTTHIFLRDGSSYAVREKLVELLARLPADSFARCHNSYVVNLSCVKALRRTDLDLEDGTLVPISRSYTKKFRTRYLLWAEAWTM